MRDIILIVILTLVSSAFILAFSVVDRVGQRERALLNVDPLDDPPDDPRDMPLSQRQADKLRDDVAFWRTVERRSDNPNERLVAGQMLDYLGADQLFERDQRRAWR